MSTTRNFISTGRSPERTKELREMIRFDMMAKGKLTAAQRNKRMLKKRMEAKLKKSGLDKVKIGFSMPTVKAVTKQNKTTAAIERIMEEKKAIREAKKLKQMVVVDAQTFTNGRIDKNGKIYDVQGNYVGKVNRKNGSITTAQGTYIGKYARRSYMTGFVLQDTIMKFSPHFINVRRLQSMQSGSVWQNSDVLDLPGKDSGVNSMQRGGVVNNAWGVRMDNVWGGASSDVWGNATQASGSIWGNPNQRTVWNSAGTAELITKAMRRLLGLLGLYRL